MQVMSLSQQRRLFSRLISEFVVWIFQQPGLECFYEEVKRTKAQATANAASGAGIANSLHLDGLAADLSLSVNGVYQSGTEAYKALGEKWESMHPLNRWGGKWGDGNHFSSTRNGVK